MAGELEAVVREMFAAFDRQDFAAILGIISDDGQGVDELSRRWLRGREAVAAYLRQLEGAIADVRSDLRDLNETVWGDAGVVTCWLEQDYTLEGQRQHVSAPTSVVLRREGGRWQIVLLHTIPLPEGDGA
jgi:uncharacterized protein (TIGR02246 family)